MIGLQSENEKPPHFRSFKMVEIGEKTECHNAHTKNQKSHRNSGENQMENGYTNLWNETAFIIPFLIIDGGP